ncbi:MAG: cysteine desulfurase [Candidatus Magasanikbacteria bacterium]|nr:cysteine desulfurase [Candidatus Magasanikbacteria bacterium]
MRQVYLDHAATTPTDARVVEKMLPYFTREFGNPSALYGLGRRAQEAIYAARRKIAQILSCRPGEIIFTGGGTESDNLAILGAARAARLIGRHIVTTKTEHHAVLHACAKLEKEGFEVTYLAVGQDGLLAPEEVIKALKAGTILVTIIYANNEIGTIEPIAEIGRAILKYNQKEREGKRGVLFHTDACQAAGALDLDVNRLHADLLTLNGSKIYGPKGIGVLYKKKEVKLEPLIYGGGQEFGLRAGTENVPAIVGLAEALEIAQKEKEKENERLTESRDYLWLNLNKKIKKLKLNGHPKKRLPNNLNFSILDVEGEAVLLYLDEAGIQAATGSACTSQSLEPSHVLLAIGLPYEFAHGSLRLTLGRQTTKADLDYVIEVLPPIVEKLRELSPVKLEIKDAGSRRHPKYKSDPR